MTMKNRIFIFIFALLLASCSLEVETNQDASSSSEELIANVLKSDYETIYEDASMEMKYYVSKELFLNLFRLQEKINGKMLEAEFQNETSGEYNFSNTQIYQYQLKNENDESFTLTAEFINGDLLKFNIDKVEGANESDFVKSLVTPVANLLREQNSNEIYQLFDGKYPLDQVESVVEEIATHFDGVPSQYESYWTDSDESGRIMVAFVYAYEAKGYLEYRFYIEEETYPLAGIFFTLDETTKLP